MLFTFLVRVPFQTKSASLLFKQIKELILGRQDTRIRAEKVQ